MTRNTNSNVDRRTFVKATGTGAAGVLSVSGSVTAVEKATGESTTSKSTLSGTVIPVGGGFDPDNEALFEEIIDRGGNGPTVAVVPTANSDPKQSLDAWRQDFEAYGASEVLDIEVAPDITEWEGNENDAEMVDRIETADIVWFSGGNQLRITDLFVPDNDDEPAVAQAIREHVENGGVVGGSSAGAAVMTEQMIAAGESRGAILDGVSAEDTYDDDTDNRVFLTEGLGYLPHGIVDQHFYERGRLGRLIRALWHERETIGYGVGENTGLIFEQGSTEVTVAGENGAMIVDLSEATESDTESEALSLTHVRVHHLSHGDSFDYENREVTVGPKDDDGTPVKFNVTDDPFYTTNDHSWDVFGAPQAVRELVTTELAVNEQESVRGTAISIDKEEPAYERRTEVRLEFLQDDRTEGWEGEYEVQEFDWRYTAIDVRLDLTIERLLLVDDTERIRNVVKAVQRGGPPHN